MKSCDLRNEDDLPSNSVNGEDIFVFPTLTKVQPPPTIQLETNTQAVKMLDIFNMPSGFRPAAKLSSYI